MENIPTLIFDDSNHVVTLHDKIDGDLIFTQGIAEYLTTYFRHGRESRLELISLLGKAYENNYFGFLRFCYLFLILMNQIKSCDYKPVI
jgi:hypothetical protein